MFLTNHSLCQCLLSSFCEHNQLKKNQKINPTQQYIFALIIIAALQHNSEVFVNAQPKDDM